jgi:PAS domain S-box-containing protein
MMSRTPNGVPLFGEREETFRRLSIAASEGITIVADGRVLDANSAFARLFGYELAEVIGRRLIDVIAPESRDLLAQRIAAQVEKPIELRGRIKSGETFDIELTIRRIAYQDREALGCVVRDITERKEIERLKSEFVSIVSHELRTPLTSIRGSLGLMEGGAAGELPPKARELVRIARQNADRLIRLINDILDLEKIESGKIQLQIQQLDPKELVESTVAELRGMAQLYKVSIETRIECAEAIAGDRDRVVQVLTNLLSNAIKFSPEGRAVTVTLSSGNPGFLRCSVEDHGQGIAPEARERLFIRFEQLEPANTRRRGGTGLGLAISRSLVEQQGGRIGVDSTVGEGSTFWFELPLVPVSNGAHVHTSPNAQPGVLIVEDDPAVARVLGIMLGRDGHQVTTANSLAEARQALAQNRPSVVLLDIKLPDGSGLDLLDELVPGTRLEGVPVVVLSGVEPSFERRARGTVVTEWLSKPFAEKELLRALREAIGTAAPPRTT